LDDYGSNSPVVGHARHCVRDDLVDVGACVFVAYILLAFFTCCPVTAFKRDEKAGAAAPAIGLRRMNRVIRVAVTLAKSLCDEMSGSRISRHSDDGTGLMFDLIFQVVQPPFVVGQPL
jgi:hypothetical protein